MFQQTTIVGYLGRDPEMRFTKTGKPVTTLNVAVSQYGEKGPLWFRVSVWNNQAESCNEHLQKGSLVLVVGRLTGDNNTGGPKVYEKNDGSHGANFEMTANNVRFISKSSNQSDVGFSISEIDQQIPF